jgi:hypothetical protein
MRTILNARFDKMEHKMLLIIEDNDNLRKYI